LVGGSSSLRGRVEALEQQLARLLERRARLRDEAGWLTKENKLLVKQRAALREENEQLEGTRATLDARKHTLQRTLAAAQAEHDRLSSQAATRETRNTERRHSVKVRRAATAAAQTRNNDSVETIGGLQTEISSLRGQIRAMTRFIAPRVDKVVQGARDASVDSALAGLLAVKASRLTPFGPDAASHPDVYNALWFALNRLDANTARELIAPVAKPSGKVGTTQSALIVKKICGLVTRPLTQDEWKLYLPARAPYTAKSSQPCA
jgi:chromosome segregation protein